MCAEKKSILPIDLARYLHVAQQVKLFKGYRVQHNNLLGPYKGGLRFDKHVYLDEVKSLALWMTLKNSLQKCINDGVLSPDESFAIEYSNLEISKIKGKRSN